MDDNQHWNKVAEKGYKNIFENVKKGFYGERGIMPPKGNCLDCLDTELQVYIIHVPHQKIIKKINISMPHHRYNILSKIKL